MRYLLDTDHITVLQMRPQPDHANFLARAAGSRPSDFAYSIVSFAEQARGALALINAARDSAEVVRRYVFLERLLKDYSDKTVVPFDRAAANEFDRLRSARVRGGTMDLRIASIALCRGLTLLTRNTRDFARVPGLNVEDWTA